jgi:hypothetical protein
MIMLLLEFIFDVLQSMLTSSEDMFARQCSYVLQKQLCLRDKVPTVSYKSNIVNRFSLRHASVSALSPQSQSGTILFDFFQ